ncbi:carboxypeptidase regulatory-like domain-containing protein [Alkalispirochaeta alkalica]|uniref:carboxypeptidase regulatory-like domain-containing protein n=1 Tax=Alkalispirochaeta alkalica TaxID=46356 RepID=UPI0003A54281|nr:carboxypeptidase regulatory-like domain-containing protein [Alkalispirochaeta alkalica]
MFHGAQHLRTGTSRNVIMGTLLLCLSSAHLLASEITITVRWGTFSPTQLAGALLLPEQPDGSRESVQGRNDSSEDGHVSSGGGDLRGMSMNSLAWRIEPPQQGLYQLYLFPQAESGFNMRAWDSQVVVEVEIEGEVRRLDPPSSSNGNAWHALTLNGATGEIHQPQRFFPVRRMIYGNVRNAQTGEPLAGVTVRLVDALSGSPLEGQTAVTSDTGFYVLHSFPMGRYAVTFEQEDYIEARSSVDFMRYDLPALRNALLSQDNLPPSSVRIALSWGATPPDLDAHLRGPAGEDEEFHISYHNMRIYDERHYLDVDAREGFGPETITINGLDPGTYRFTVHDFTNRRNRNSWGLAGSGARVTVYHGSQQVAEFPVPQREGTVWDVFTIDGTTGALTPLNELRFAESP